MAVILVVEDDPALAEMLRTVLEDAGHRVTVMHALAAARPALATAQLVIADVGLPDGSGLDIAQEAAALRIPVLITTGHPSRMVELEDEQRAYLRKPFRVHELQQRIGQLLGAAARRVATLPARNCA
jgi:DNA-binding response OmpR family regulator